MVIWSKKYHNYIFMHPEIKNIVYMKIEFLINKIKKHNTLYVANYVICLI